MRIPDRAAFRAAAVRSVAAAKRAAPVLMIVLGTLGFAFLVNVLGELPEADGPEPSQENQAETEGTISASAGRPDEQEDPGFLAAVEEAEDPRLEVREGKCNPRRPELLVTARELLRGLGVERAAAGSREDEFWAEAPKYATVDDEGEIDIAARSSIVALYDYAGNDPAGYNSQLSRRVDSFFDRSGRGAAYPNAVLSALVSGECVIGAANPGPVSLAREIAPDRVEVTVSFELGARAEPPDFTVILDPTQYRQVLTLALEGDEWRVVAAELPTELIGRLPDTGGGP